MNGLLTASSTVAGLLVLAQPVVPVHEEPHHKTIFENAWVRALDVHFPVGVDSMFHRHALHNVAVRIAGGTIRSDRIGAEGTPREVRSGSVMFNSASPPYVHRVVNVGAAAVHIVDLELSGARVAADGSAADVLAGHVVEIENEHVRVSRLRLQPGEFLSAHTHQRGWLDVVVAGPKPGAIAWHDAGTQSALGGPDSPAELVEIEPKFPRTRPSM